MAARIMMSDPVSGKRCLIFPPIRFWHLWRLLMNLRFWPIPLLQTRSHRLWGLIGLTLFIAFWALLVANRSGATADPDVGDWWPYPGLAYLLLGVVFAARIPRIVAVDRIERGWWFSDPDDDQVKRARSRWRC